MVSIFVSPSLELILDDHSLVYFFLFSEEDLPFYTQFGACSTLVLAISMDSSVGYGSKLKKFQIPFLNIA